jgi:hypothetical protein
MWELRPHFTSAVFWGGGLFWIVLLHLRIVAEDLNRREQISVLQRAIVRSPNVDLVEDFPELFQKAAGLTVAPSSTEHVALLSQAENRSKAIDRQKELERSIQAILQLIAAMAKSFGRGTENTHYGANVMLVEKRGEDLTAPFRSGIAQHTRLTGHTPPELVGVNAIVYLLKALADVTDPKHPTRTLDVFALPVPANRKDDRGRRLALPGAPWSLLTGQMKVYEDAQRIVERCQDFSAPVRDQIEAYFGKHGDGESIRSFLSYRIGSVGDPIGVLNIDCSRTHLLGAAPEYYATFLALLRPMVHLLAVPVAEYSWLNQLLSSDIAPASAPALQATHGDQVA